MALEEFARDFLQDVLAESDADGQFLEDVFFQKTCEHLMEAGELDSTDRAPYLGPPGRGIRVDGYGGDPAVDDSDTLSLLVVDFQPSPQVGRLAGTEMNAIFRRLGNFLRHALDRKWRDALEETSPAFGFLRQSPLSCPHRGILAPNVRSVARRYVPGVEMVL